MRTLSLLAQKGGAGKTTLAVHLAVLAESLGHRVAIIDTDPQKSAADWWRARKIARPAMAECEPKNLARALESAAKRGFTLAIVDTPPHAGQIAYLVAETVDFNLIPCRPAPFDLRAIGKTVDIINHLNAPAGIVINAAPPNRGDTEVPPVIEARKVLQSYNLPVAPLAIPERPAYSHPMEDGRTYIEHFPSGKPAREIAELWAWVQKQMGAPAAQPNARAAARAAQPRPGQKPTPAQPQQRPAQPQQRSGQPPRGAQPQRPPPTPPGPQRATQSRAAAAAAPRPPGARPAEQPAPPVAAATARGGQ